jgi:hypothetical protein
MSEQRFVPLPSRPMIDLELAVGGLDRATLEVLLARELGRLDPDSILRPTIDAWPTGKAGKVLSAAGLRRLATDMNIDLRLRSLRRTADGAWNLGQNGLR